MAIEPVTRALRERSPGLLRAGLRQLLADREREWLEDSRDLLWALAPYHDCARRLGLDPVGVFDEAATAGPASIADLVRDFGRRTDVRPSAFAFSVDAAVDGPEYRWT
jgi:hypothetical protein